MIVRTMEKQESVQCLSSQSLWPRIHEEIDGYEVVELRPCQYVVVEQGVFDAVLSKYSWEGIRFSEKNGVIVRVVPNDEHNSLSINTLLRAHYGIERPPLRRKDMFYSTTNYLDFRRINYTKKHKAHTKSPYTKQEFYKRCPLLGTKYYKDMRQAQVSPHGKKEKTKPSTCFIPEEGYKHIVYSKGDKGYTFRVRLRYMAGCSVLDWMRPVFETPEEAEEARKKLLDDQRALVGDFEGLPVVKQAI